MGSRDRAHVLGLIEALARRSAVAGLGLRDARQLFEALYIADALVLSQGSVTGAADIAGVTPASLWRKRRDRDRMGEEQDG